MERAGRVHGPCRRTQFLPVVPSRYGGQPRLKRALLTEAWATTILWILPCQARFCKRDSHAVRPFAKDLARLAVIGKAYHTKPLEVVTAEEILRQHPLNIW